MAGTKKVKKMKITAMDPDMGVPIVSDAVTVTNGLTNNDISLDDATSYSWSNNSDDFVISNDGHAMPFHVAGDIGIHDITITRDMAETLKIIHEAENKTIFNIFSKDMDTICNQLEEINDVINEPYELPHDLIEKHKKIQELMKGKDELIKDLKSKTNGMAQLKATVHGYLTDCTSCKDAEQVANTTDRLTLKSFERVLSEINNKLDEVLGC